MKTYALVLAAGKSKRMNSNQSKMIEKILDRPMIEYVIDAIKESGVDEIYVVVGYNKEQIMNLLQDKVKYIIQEEQLGTAHALSCAYEELKDKEGDLLITCGDMPLLTTETFLKVIRAHQQEQSAATLLVGEVTNPTGLGRIITKEQEFMKIVEEKDANNEEKAIHMINSGTYCFNIQVLFHYLNLIANHNQQKEYYLTDIFEELKKAHQKVFLIEENDETCLWGVNDYSQLQKATQEMKRRINTEHLKQGVNIVEVDNTYIGKNVLIEKGSTIHPFSFIYGNTKIGAACQIGPFSYINNAKILDRSKVLSSFVDDSEIHEDCQIGPYANIKQGSVIHDHVVIGDYVEVKKSEIGSFTKAKHHTYIGDASIMNHVNVGCGVIFANYDGKKKHRTLVKENVFIGSNVTLVAPLEIGGNAYIAAGSTITQNIPENSLAIARQTQTNKLEYVSKMKTRED